MRLFLQDLSLGYYRRSKALIAFGIFIGLNFGDYSRSKEIITFGVCGMEYL